MKQDFALFASLLVTLYSSSSLADETNTVTPEAFTNSMMDVSEKVRAGYSNFIPAVSSLMGTNYGPALAKGLTSFETNVLTGLTNSALPEMVQGEQFLVALKQSGHLPGVPQDSHGNMAVNAPLSAFQEAKYPFSVTIDLVLNGDSLTNHYTVMRPAKDDAWQLERAWRTDTQGQSVVEWPVR